jgi:hypothetical protein
MFAGGHDHDRQGHDRQRQAGGQDTGAEFEKDHEGADTEQGMNDRRHTGQVDDGQVDRAGEPVIRSVFAQVNRCCHAQWHRGQQGHDDQQHGTQQGRENAAGGHAVGRAGKQEFERDYRRALVDQCAQDQRYRQDQDAGHRTQSGTEPLLPAAVFAVELGCFKHF